MQQPKKRKKYIAPLRNGVRNNKDGSVSTHLMTSSESGGKYQAYPTLFQNKDNSWLELPNGNEGNWQALKEATKRKEVYNFNTEEEAQSFANGSWKMPLKSEDGLNTKEKDNIPDNGHMKTRKKIVTVKKKDKKVPKAFLGTALAVGSTVAGIIGTAKQNKIQEEEAEIARQRALASQQSTAVRADNVRLEDHSYEGNTNVNYYQAKGGKIDPGDKAKKVERAVTNEEAEANSYKNSPDSMFTADGIKMLGAVDETIKSVPSNIDYGKYKDLGYFKESQSGETTVLSPTSKNIRNAQDHKTSLKYLQKLNPTIDLGSDASTGYVPSGRRMAKGGKTPVPYNTKGGELDPLSSDMVIAKGNKHGESKIDGTSGIKLMDEQGKPFVEIEDEETIKDGTKVYSDQTIYAKGKTYAETAEGLAKKKGKLEEGINIGTSLHKNTAKRKLVGLDMQEDALFAHQEANKPKSSSDAIPTANLGGDFDPTRRQGIGSRGAGTHTPVDTASFNGASALAKVGKGINAVLPFVDNIVNASLTKNTPDVAKPLVDNPVSFETEYNANPQLAGVTDAVNASNEDTKNNTSNSNIARNRMNATRLQGSKQKASILANKENIEIGLRNQNTQQNQATASRNNASINQYQDKVFARANDIQSRTSANVANAVGDVIDKRNFDSAESYNKERLDIARQYDVKGTSMRADLNNPTEVNKLKTDDTYYNEQLERYKDNPKELERLKAVRGGRTLATPNFN